MSRDSKASKKLRNDLMAHGFVWVRNSGDHYILKKDGYPPVSVPQKLNKMIERRLRKQYLV